MEPQHYMSCSKPTARTSEVTDPLVVVLKITLVVLNLWLKTGVLGGRAGTMLCCYYAGFAGYRPGISAGRQGTHQIMVSPLSCKAR